MYEITVIKFYVPSVTMKSAVQLDTVYYAKESFIK